MSKIQYIKIKHNLAQRLQDRNYMIISVDVGKTFDKVQYCDKNAKAARNTVKLLQSHKVYL